MKRYGKKIHWNAKAVCGFSAAVALALALGQVPKFYNFWIWGSDTGYRTAGFDSGHYQRQFPSILRDMPTIGHVFLGEDERLIIDYRLTVEEGTASFIVWRWPSLANRPQDIGPRSIAKTGSGRIEIPSPGSGFYQIAMHAHRLQGDVTVDWTTQQLEQRTKRED